MNVIVSKNYFPINIEKIEEKYDVKYLGDFQIKNKNGNYSNTPLSIFYQKNPDLSKGHSNYLGVFCTYNLINDKLVDKMYLTDGKSAFEDDFNGIKLVNGDILVSCFTHDFKTNGDSMVDGGEIVKLRMVNGEWVLVTNQFVNNNLNLVFENIKSGIFTCLGKRSYESKIWEIKNDMTDNIFNYTKYEDYINDIDELIKLNVIIESN